MVLNRSPSRTTIPVRWIAHVHEASDLDVFWDSENLLDFMLCSRRCRPVNRNTGTHTEGVRRSKNPIECLLGYRIWLETPNRSQSFNGTHNNLRFLFLHHKVLNAPRKLPSLKNHVIRRERRPKTSFAKT